MSGKTIEQVTAEYAELETNLKSAKDKIAELEKEKGLIGSYSGEPEERRLLRSFGCTDVKSLIEKNIAAPEFAHVPLTTKMEALELKKQIDIARWYAQIFDGAPTDKGEMESQNHIARVLGVLQNPAAKSFDLQNRLKAFGTTVSTGGAEWIETAISSSYIDEYLLEKKVANLFQEIPMPTNPFKLPKVGAGTTARIIGEGAAGTGNNSTTAAITFDAKNKLFELYNLPEELNEDSAVTFLSLGRAQVLDAQLRAAETAIINGDSDGTHMDMTNTYDADDARRAVDGLRKLALANSANGGTLDFSTNALDVNLDKMLKQGGKYTINPRECVFIVSPSIYHQMTALDDVTTVDKFGPLATILTGLLAAYKGRGIVASEYLAETMNASGIVAAGGTKGGVLLVNKTRFFLGRRRPIKIRVAMDQRAEYDRWQLASYQRMDFKGCVQAASEVSVVFGYNATL